MQVQGEPASGRDIAALVFGILGLTGFCIGPVLAIALGMGQRNGLARAGMILGWVGLAMYALVAGVVVLFLLVGGLESLPR